MERSRNVKAAKLITLQLLPRLSSSKTRKAIELRDFFQFSSKAYHGSSTFLPRRYIRPPGTGRPPSGPPKILQSCFDIDRSRSEAYLQARTLHSSSPETTKPCRMDTQETLSEQEWRLVGSDQHLKDNITVVMKFTDGTALGTLPPDTIGNNVLQAAGLN